MVEEEVSSLRGILGRPGSFRSWTGGCGSRRMLVLPMFTFFTPLKAVKEEADETKQVGAVGDYWQTERDGKGPKRGGRAEAELDG